MFAASAEQMTNKFREWWTWLLVWAPDLVIALLAVWVISSEYPRTLPGEVLFDLGSFVASGQAARDGLNPYGIYPPLTFHLVLPGFETWNPNLNPPISALLFQLFGLAEPHRMFRIWYCITAVLYAGTIALLLARYKTAPRLVFTLWACSLAGFWETLALGQIYVPLVLASVAAWLLLERGATAWAGVLIGLVVAIKPNFAVWPALLLLTGHFRPALFSIVTAAVVSAIPAAVLGVQVYQQWFALIASDSARAVFLTNVSLGGLAARAGLPLVGMGLSLVLLAGSAFWAWARRRPVNDVSAIALVVALLAAPVAWVHYTLFLLPVICARWRMRGMWSVAAALMVTVSFVTRQLDEPVDVQLTLGSIYGWAVVLLLVLLVTDELRKAGLLGAPATEPRNADAAAPMSSEAVAVDERERGWIPSWAPRGPNLLLALVALVLIAGEFRRTLPGASLLDFGSFIASGQAAREGLNPYGIYPLTFHVVIGDKDGWNPNLNPPVSALLFQAFGWTEPHRMFRFWYCITIALYGAAIFLLLRRYRRTPLATFALCAVAMAGLWETLILGQIYVPLVLATVGAWLLLEQRSTVAAGILIGVVVALKPNFAVWPALLFFSGRFRPALVSAATALFISAIPAVVFGPEIYRQWFEMLAAEKGRTEFLTNASIIGLADRAGLPLLGRAASVLLLGAAAVWALTRRASVREISGVALVVSLLASPIAWVNYSLFLLPVLCWRWSSQLVRIAAAILLIPVPFVLAELPNPGLRMLTRGSLYNWALLLLLTALVARELRRHGVTSRTQD